MTQIDTETQRRQRAQRVIERYHAGLLDAKAYASALAALMREELAGELAVPVEPGVAEAWREVEGRDVAPGIWLVIADDRCAYCGRRRPVLGLKADPDEEGGWVKICLDDLKLIEAQAQPALEAAADEGGKQA